jgi:hypothetical protein
VSKVLFNLLVVNNWFVCEEGFEAVTEAKWVRFFFLGFHIVGVILANNLVIAFIISNFMQQLALMREENEVVEGAVIENGKALFDASIVTGTKTSLSGTYIARLRRDKYGDDTKRLRSLFSRGSSVVDKNNNDV